MKIYNMKVLTPDGDNKLQDISFNTAGLSIIYGDVVQPEDQSKTINSIGKTLALQFIDFLLGKEFNTGKNRNYSVTLKDYILTGTLFDVEAAQTFNVKRTIGNNTKNYINGKNYKKLSKYIEKLKIDRSLLSKQIHTFNQDGLFSYSRNANIQDYLSILELLNMEELGETASEIKKVQTKIVNNKDLKKSYEEIYKTEEKQDLEKESFYVDKEIQELEEKLNDIKVMISSINTVPLKEDIIEKYNSINSKIKFLINKKNEKELEIVRSEKFIENSEKVDFSSGEIKVLYEKAKFEIPEMVQRRLDEVEKFNSKVFHDRKLYLEENIKTLIKEKKNISNNIEELTKEHDELGKIISENKVYQEQISIYSKYTDQITNLKYRQGQLSDIKIIEERNINLEGKLSENFLAAHKKVAEFEKLINEYKNFVFDLVKDIYEDDIKAYFNIEVIDEHKRNLPVRVNLTIDGDVGEGVGNVKKIIIDLLIFKYNDKLEILIEDSARFNGIDNRQIHNILKSIHDIGVAQNKQAIITINKYQLDEVRADEIDKYIVLKLSEDKKLLGFNF